MILRIFGYLFGIGAVLFLVVATGVAWFVSDLASDLPDYDVLAKYEPPVTTRIHAADGQLVAEYARERRLYLPIQAVPDRVKAAFLSAEDKNFYDHSGLDYYGIARAVVQNLQSYGSGQRLVGASTITQQVAKNFLKLYPSAAVSHPARIADSNRIPLPHRFGCQKSIVPDHQNAADIFYR